MFGKSSKVQPNVALSGSGALSHVYIQHPPLRCQISGSRGIYYDDANKLLLLPTTNQVYSWKTSSPTLENTPTSDSIDEGPIFSIRYSLDGKVLAIQRSNQEIQFRDRETGEAFVQRCKLETESILGLIWTDCPICDVIIIKTSGLDLFSYEPRSKALNLVETKKLNVSWYAYTHESRMLLLASGMQCKTFSAFQFSSAGIIRLPRFEMVMAKSEANQKPVLAAEDLHLVTIYGRIYCLQVDKVAMVLHFYRFYRDAVVQQGSFPVYSSKVAVSTVDNVILVHQVDAKVVILYDIFAESHAPISAPLPLLLRGFPRANVSSSRFSGTDETHVETNEMNDYEGIIYGDGWTFLVPDIICDAVHGTLWRIHLDLEAIAASSSEVSSVLEFLQRRKLESSKAKQLSISITRTSILERQPLSVVSRAIDTLVASYLHSLKSANSVPKRPAGGEKSSDPGNEHFGDSRTRADVPTSSSETQKGSLKHESGLENASKQSIRSGVENELADATTGSTVNRTSISSDTEENVHMPVPRTSSAELLEKNHTNCEISVAEIHQSFLQTQGPETGSSSSHSDFRQQSETQVASAAISPDEMYKHIFAPVDEEMPGDPAYLVAVIVEYLRSAASEKLKVHPSLNVMTVQLLARSERFAELWLFVLNKIVEPSKDVALQLIESGRQNFQTRKLGIDMLRQLSFHHDYVLLLVQDGYYLEALRYARKNQVNTIRPSLFLEAASNSDNSQNLAAVLRFFSDFIPGFKNTSDYSTYIHVLNGMNATTVVA